MLLSFIWMNMIFHPWTKNSLLPLKAKVNVPSCSKLRSLWQTFSIHSRHVRMMKVCVSPNNWSNLCSFKEFYSAESQRLFSLITILPSDKNHSLTALGFCRGNHCLPLLSVKFWYINTKYHLQFWPEVLRQKLLQSICPWLIIDYLLHV